MSWDHFTGAAGLVLGFSGLILVHELGHFLLARWNGVRVQVFSLGMGPYLVSVTKGETVYVLSLIPIGGYVKMAGQDDLRPSLGASADPRDYRSRPPGARAAILAAGACFNLLFALILFTLCYYYGVEMLSPHVGEVAPDAPIGQAKSYGPDGHLRPDPLHAGDRITMISGEPIKMLLEANLEVASAGADRDLLIHYERDGTGARDPVVVRTETDPAVGAASIGLTTPFIEEECRVGFTLEKGVYVYFVGEGSAAAQAGLAPGDRITTLDGQEVRWVSQVLASIKWARGREQEMVVEREGKTRVAQLKGVWNQKQKRFMVGLAMVYRVAEIEPACEAYQAGLRRGHFIPNVGKLRNDRELELEAREQLDKPGRVIRIPNETACGSPLVLVWAFPRMEQIKCESLGEALGLAWTDLWRHSTTVFIILKGLFTRQVSVEAMSGPVGIGLIITSAAVQEKLMYYLWFLALLSLNLGVLQFVPVPLLDGWHLLMVGIEKLKGKPVPVKVQEACHWVGVVIILGLLLLVTRNDILRVFSL